MRHALLAVRNTRTILFSLCDWGQADVEKWGPRTGNSWRMSGDIQRKDFIFPRHNRILSFADVAYSKLASHLHHRQSEQLRAGHG
jgi:hypothetical protein